MNRVIILTRTSTARQIDDRQQHDLFQVCKERNYNIVKTYSETISGKFGINERSVLQEILALAKEKKFDKLLVHEISRIGRRHVYHFIEMLTEYKVSVYIHNYGIETLDANLNQNPIMGMVFNFLSSFADLERKLIVERVRSGLNDAKRKGKVLGRPLGKTKDDENFINENRNVISLIEKGLTIRQIVKLTGRSSTTVCKLNRILKKHQNEVSSIHLA